MTAPLAVKCRYQLCRVKLTRENDDCQAHSPNSRHLAYQGADFIRQIPSIQSTLIKRNPSVMIHDSRFTNAKMCVKEKQSFLLERFNFPYMCDFANRFSYNINEKA